MRPSLGVIVELIALAGAAWAGVFVPGGLPFILYVAVFELVATYLIHCPAHYVVGQLLGIRFVSMRIGRTTLAKALPPRLSRFARLAPIISLRPDRPSLSRAGSARSAAMYASGTVASVLSAFAVAVWVTPGASPALILVAWGIAIGYLIFDLVFSPRSGDLMRARRAVAVSGAEPFSARK